MVQREKYQYHGEIDVESKPCGVGSATRVENGWTHHLSGTWMDGKPHGVCEYNLRKSFNLTNWYRHLDSYKR